MTVKEELKQGSLLFDMRGEEERHTAACVPISAQNNAGMCAAARQVKGGL